MKKSRLLTWLLLLPFLSPLSAQSDTGFAVSNPLYLPDYLPPLPLLIDSARAHSPEMGSAEATVLQSELTLKLAKKDWSELFSISGRYTYGQLVGIDAVGLALSEPRVGYQVFAGLSLPLSYFIGRKDRMRTLEASRTIQENNEEQTSRQIEELVIQTYNQLILLQKQINISAEARESALLQYDMAEERFRDGRITLEELGRSTELKANIAFKYEELRSDFAYYYSLLERIVGTPFSQFPK